MTNLAFSNIGCQVFGHSCGRTFSLSSEQVEQMLSIFDEGGAHRLYNALYESSLAAGGVERCRSSITLRASKTEWAATPEWRL